MKRKKCLITATLLIISLGGTLCLHRGEKRNTIIKNDVVIKACTVNDLGQVLIFVTDKDNRELLFVKDFYSRSKSRKSTAEESYHYLNQVKRLRNRQVTILYFENYAGNREIEKIIE